MRNKYFFWSIAFLLCLYLTCLNVNYDFDFFARIIVGEQFVEHGILPFKDFLSYTPTHPWYDHEWGSGIIFYLILKHLGPIGLILFNTIAMFGTLFFTVKAQQIQKHSYPVSMIFVTTFCILFNIMNPALIRCHLFTFFFFSVFLYALEKEKKCGTKLLWIIPIIIILWNNLHGGVVSGLGLIFMYIIGEFLNKRKISKLIKILCISLPALIINPYGIKYLQFLLSATTKQRKYIVEWWSFLAPKHILYYLPASLFCIISYISKIINDIRKKQYDYTKLIVLTVTLAEGLLHIKLLPLALITISVFCYNDIYRLFLQLRRTLKTFEKSCCYAIIILALTIPLYSPQIPRANLYKFPLYEVEFLKINEIKGNLIAPFGLSSYIIYKLYPDNLIYMDGRYEEVYEDEIFLDLRDFNLALPNWRDNLKKYNTEILMPSKNTDIYDVLMNDKEWINIFNGILCGVFVKKENLKKIYYNPEYNIDYYRKTMFRATKFGSKLKRIK